MNESDDEIEKEAQLRDPVCNSELPGFASTNSDGLTKRELIAAMCMQGICANSGIEIAWPEAARMAINAADALLKELED